MSALDGRAISVTAIAKTVVMLATIDFLAALGGCARTLYAQRSCAELRRYLSNYVRSSLDQRMESLVKEAEFAHYRSAVGSIVIATLSLLSFYTLALSSLPRFDRYLDVNFALSPFIVLFFAGGFFPVIRWSGFPPAFFGIRLDNWRAAALFALTSSLAFIAVGALLKWIIILCSPSLAGIGGFQLGGCEC
jgi:hypothetical protein